MVDRNIPKNRIKLNKAGDCLRIELKMLVDNNRDIDKFLGRRQKKRKQVTPGFAGQRSIPDTPEELLRLTAKCVEQAI